jgi:hypothetical protein
MHGKREGGVKTGVDEREEKESGRFSIEIRQKTFVLGAPALSPRRAREQKFFGGFLQKSDRLLNLAERNP